MDLLQKGNMVIVWRVTEHCNLSCKFCGYDRELARERMETDARQLYIFGKVLADYQGATGDSVLVSWLGGEPLLWSPLTEISQHFFHDYRLRLSATTNGTTLSSATVRKHLLMCYAEVTVSIDGLADFHNESRHWKNGFNTLRQSVSLLANGKKETGAGLLLRANVVLMNTNVKAFPDLCAELAGWGIEEITFNQLGGIERPDFFPHHRLLPSDVAWLREELPDLSARLAARGIRLRGSAPYLQRIEASALGQRMAVEDCYPGQSFLFVTTTGKVAPCNFTSDSYGIPVSELDSVTALRQLPIRFKEMRGKQRSSFCDDCHSTHVFEKFSL